MSHQANVKGGTLVPVGDRRIKRIAVPSLDAVRGKYQLILEDMVENGGLLVPEPNWLRTVDSSKPAESYDNKAALKFALSEDHYQNKVSNMELLMKAWVGSAKPPSKSDISRYHHLLKQCDVLDLWAANVNSTVSLARQDLGSLMDLNLLYSFSESSPSKPTTMLEVGVGYGRLAEATFNIFGNTVLYVIMDAVPASLYYAREYLARACPDARVISYYDSEPASIDLSNCDIAIIPAWHFERLNRLRFDVCINIESMQEMNQHHVDYYLNLFDSVTDEGAMIYLSNSREYYFRGEFKYPVNWEKRFCANTPRSWTFDHPTEIFRKTKLDHSMQNSVLDAFRQYRLWLETDPGELVKRNGAIKVGMAFLKTIAGRIGSRVGHALRLK